ncbi:MAG TPA: ABC transporter permease subunit [Acetivibrio clariflavus]|nr:ABC transporter permease subunit [Acetivibrio clariflavus]HPU41996.1 ABC transporter permease subunit [Acetivibrio clariflavus]
MESISLALNKRPQKKYKKNSLWRTIVRQRQLIFMSFPLLIYVFIFSYVPLVGWIMAFQNFRPGPGRSIFNQKWVGFENFEFLFTDESFLRVLRNTIGMSLINIVFSFLTAITLALLLNEVKNIVFKKTVQTISYLPYFISWVIACGIISQALSAENGIVNVVLMKLHLIDQPVSWLGKGNLFWLIFGLGNIWKNVGFNAIIYLGAMTAIDPNLYEAAEIDGAGRFRKMWHITLPGLKSTIIVLLIMNIASVLNVGFEFQYLLGNGLNIEWSETIDVFTLKYGISKGNYSLATAAGMFKTVVSVVLLFLANWFAKLLGEERLI